MLLQKIYNFDVFDLEKNKFVIYEKNSYNHQKLNIIDSNSHFINKTVYIPFDKGKIEKFYNLKNYNNIVFFSLRIPLLTLILLDYELNQINTIIELIDTCCPKENFFYFCPYIEEIKQLKNNKLLIIGNQHYESDYPPHIMLKYDFKIIFNFDKFEIDLAENYIEC